MSECPKKDFCSVLSAQRVGARPYAHRLECIGRWKHKAGLLTGIPDDSARPSPLLCCGCTLAVATGGRHAGQAVGNPKPCETCTRTALRDRSNDLTFSPLVNGRSKATRDFQNKDTPSTAKNCVEMDWDMGRDAKSNDESECDIDNEKLYEDMPSLVGMTASDLVGQSWTPICVEDDDSDDEVHSEDEGGDGEWEKQEPVTVPCTTVRECQLDDMPQYDPLFMENSDTSGNNQDQQSFAGHDTTKPSSQGLWGYLTRRGTYGSSSESPTTAASDLSTSSSSPSSSSASSSSFSSCTCSSPAQDPQDSEQRLFDTWLSFRDSNSLIPELDGDGRVLLMQENGLDLTDMTGSGASEITSPRLHQLSSGGETAVAPRVRKDASFCESPAAEPQEYQDGSNDSSGTLRNSRRNVSSRARIPRVSGLAGPAKDGRPTTTVAEHIAGGPRRFHRATSVVADAGIGQKASTIVSNENDLGVTSRSVRHGIVTKITPVIPDKDNSAVGVNDLDDAARSPSAEDATWDRRAFSKNTAHVAKAEVAPIHGRPTATVVEHIAGEFAGFFRTPVVRSCGDVGDEGNDLWHLRAAERTYPRSSDVFPEETAPAAVSRCSTVSSVGDMPAETVAARDDAHVAVVVDDAGTEDCAEDELPLLEKLGSNSGCVHEGDQVPQRDNHRTNHDPAWRKSSPIAGRGLSYPTHSLKRSIGMRWGYGLRPGRKAFDDDGEEEFSAAAAAAASTPNDGGSAVPAATRCNALLAEGWAAIWACTGDSPMGSVPWSEVSSSSSCQGGGSNGNKRTRLSSSGGQDPLTE